jgi:hypothetical protein
VTAPLFVRAQSGFGLTLVLFLLIGPAIVLYELAFEDGRLSPAGPIAAAIATLMFFLISPLRYEVMADQVKVVFLVYRWTIPFEQVASVTPGRRGRFFRGRRFGANPFGVITIWRRESHWFAGNGWQISPEDRDSFIKALESALARYRRAATSRR